MLAEFFSYYAPHRRLFLMDFGCAVLAGLLSLSFPLAVTAFVDVLLPRGDWGLIGLAAAGLLVIYLINTGLMVIVTYWGHVLGMKGRDGPAGAGCRRIDLGAHPRAQRRRLADTLRGRYAPRTRS